MPRAAQTEIRLRLVVDQPVPGVAHSLQDKQGGPVDVRISKQGEALVFEFPIRIGAGPKFYGDHVRSEGPERRFIYVAIGQSAGQCGSPWSRRMKIDIHRIPQSLLDQAAGGKTLEAVILGTGKDGTPACATVVPAEPWRAA